MFLNLCKSYSVLAVICITCLLIFTKLEGDLQVFMRFNYENYNRQNHGSFVLVHSQASALREPPESANQSQVLSPQMDNNNSSKKDAMSPVEDGVTPAPLIEDAVDGNFSGSFNIKMLNDHLKRCIREKDHEVDMDEYIQIFQQLYKFFCMLGTVFGFIGSDVKSKIEILQGYRDGANKTHYETVEKMISFETSTDFIHSNKETSGSRTFLRLHRALIFVTKFLGKMESIGEQEGTSRICKEAYSQTLSKFHPWLIQKGAGLAMLGLPIKKDLIAKVCANGMVASEEVIPIMHDVIQFTGEIYDHCDNLYTENDLHGLP